MNALGWSRRGQDEPVNTSQQTGLLSSLKSLNPFGDGGYVRLPTNEGTGAPLPAPTRREEEEGWFTCESSIVTRYSCCLRESQSPLQRSRPQSIGNCYPTRALGLITAHKHAVLHALTLHVFIRFLGQRLTSLPSG